MTPAPITSSCLPPESADDFSVMVGGSGGFVEIMPFGSDTAALAFYSSEFTRLLALYNAGEIEDFTVSFFENGSLIRERGFNRKAIA